MRPAAAAVHRRTDLLVRAMNAIGVGIIALCAALVVVLPRRYAAATLLCGLFLVPLDEILEVGPLHFNSVRILLLVAFSRILVRGEWNIKKRSTLDLLVVAHVVTSAVAYICLRRDLAAVINRLGVSYELILSYIVIRALLQDKKAFETALCTLVVICAIIGAGMVVEHATHRIVFASIGGANDTPAIREGRTRCQGPFQHAIMAGVFGAACFPLCLSLLWTKERRLLLAATGAISTCAIVWASGSSTPAMCLLASMGALCAWHIRRYLSVVRWMAIGVLIVLHFVMKDPVWALVARGGVFAGSTGYYRYMLIDLFIKNVGDWWLLGTDAYIEWSRAYGTGLWDACNMYVRQGIDGGLLTLGLFCCVIAVAFRSVGKQARLSRTSEPSQLMVWALGASVFAHCNAFIGLNYFDGQISAAWYMLLAMIAGVDGMRGSERTRDNAIRPPYLYDGRWSRRQDPFAPTTDWSVPSR